MDSVKFIVDSNVGKLGRWLRIMGYDTVLFDSKEEDDRMIAVAIAQNRVILTRDTQLMKRRLITSGSLKAVLLASDETDRQIRQVVEAMQLGTSSRPFSRCLECNEPLVARTKEEVRLRVPPFVFQTQDQYMECPVCHRIYWRGTHWQAMTRKIEKLTDVHSS